MTFKLRPPRGPKETVLQRQCLNIIAMIPRCQVVNPDAMKTAAIDLLLDRQLANVSPTAPALVVWRQNTGVFWVGGEGTDRGGKKRPITASIPGTPDIVGMVAPFGVFFGCEVKTPKGVHSAEQKRFQRMVERCGGIYILCRNPYDLRRQIEEALLGLSSGFAPPAE